MNEGMASKRPPKPEDNNPGKYICYYTHTHTRICIICSIYLLKYNFLSVIK